MSSSKGIERILLALVAALVAAGTGFLAHEVTNGGGPSEDRIEDVGMGVSAGTEEAVAAPQSKDRPVLAVPKGGEISTTSSSSSSTSTTSPSSSAESSRVSSTSTVSSTVVKSTTTSPKKSSKSPKQTARGAAKSSTPATTARQKTSSTAKATTTASTAQSTTSTTAEATTTSSTAKPTPPPPANGLTEVELELIRLTNELRTNPNGPLKRQGPNPSCDGLEVDANGRPVPQKALIVDTNVSINMARDWSQHMADTDRFEHRSGMGSYLTSLGVSWSYVSENIFKLWNYPDDQVAQVMFTGWRESDGHYCNMMRSTSTHIGVGHVAVGGSDWATQNFYTRR